MDDEKIIELYFERDESSIAQTEKKYGRLCYGVILRVLSDEQDAQECLNDVYLSVWNAIPPERPRDLRAFICRISRNLALKRLRYNTAQKRTRDRLVSFSELEEFVPDSRIDPDSTETAQLINGFLATLRPTPRKVFLRKYWFFDTVEEIMARYGFSENKVKSMLYRTRKALAEYLRKEGVDV